MRHAESLANEKDILASRQDFSLSSRGRNDADRIAGEFFQKFGSLTGVISSPLARARETASPFCSYSHNPLELHEALTEQDLGDYSGMTYAQIETANGYEYDRTKRWDWVPKGGGESYAMVAKRLEPFFLLMEKRARLNGEGSFLVVTHAVTLRLVRALLEKTTPLYPREIARNGEIWEVDYETINKEYHISVHLLGDAGMRKSKA